jgi:Xaa-Pro aminopeptidase
MVDLVDFTKKLKIDYLDIKIPISEYNERVLKTFKGLEGKGFDLGIVYGSEFRPGDIGWLTGYEPVVEPCLMVIGKNGGIVLGGPSFDKYAKEVNPSINYRNSEELSIIEDYEGKKFSSFMDVLEECSGKKPKRVAVLTPSNIITYEIIEWLEKSSISFEFYDEYLLKEKHDKSPNELKMVEIATKITEWAMEAVVRSAKPNMRELELSAIADYVIKYAGAARSGVYTVVMSGDRVSNVGAPGSNNILKEGDLITISTSAKWEGMNGITGRTFVVGRKPNKIEDEFLSVAENSYKLALENFKYGAIASKVDEIPRKYLRSHGLIPFYSTAHNTGWTECMEGYGGFTSKSNYPIPKNIAYMIDIGIFNQPFKDMKASRVGSRIEGTLTIDSHGKVKHLNNLPLRVDELVNY